MSILGTDRLLCPISGCDWHHDEPMLGGFTTDTEANYARAEARATRVEGIIRAHVEIHTAEEWMRELQQAREQLARADEKAPRMLCAACLQAAADAEALGKTPEPILPAATIDQGMAICNRQHRIVSQAKMASSLLVPQNGHLPNGFPKAG